VEALEAQVEALMLNGQRKDSRIRKLETLEDRLNQIEKLIQKIKEEIE
jgi:wobble nucleotide-excising tRNase